MQVTRKRICSMLGTALASLGFILLIAGFSMADSKWAEEDCCQEKDCSNSAGLVDCSSALFCAGGDSYFESEDGCCFGTTDKGPSTSIFIFGAVGLGCVLFTLCMGELGDKLCCECCQKCSAVIVGIVNAIGLIFVVLLLLILVATVDSNDACESTTIYTLVGVSGIMVAATAFLGLGIICAIIVTFIECCCDDGGKEEATASP